MTMHFISGLPRSGSTLLAAILRQNPRFHAAMTSPVGSLCLPLLNKMSGGSQFAVFFSDEKRRAILRSLFDAYYSDQIAEVVFDTNRIWTGRMALLTGLFPDCRVICCVRDLGWIIDSVERMLRKSPFQTSRLFNYEPGQSVYARAQVLMDFENGLVGHSWSCLREAWFGEHASRLVVVDYRTLAERPSQCMEALYSAIGQPAFAHDFDNVAYEAEDFDSALGMPGRHSVARKVEFGPRESCIPPDLLEKHAGLQFWKREGLARNGLTVVV